MNRQNIKRELKTCLNLIQQEQEKINASLEAVKQALKTSMTIEDTETIKSVFSLALQSLASCEGLNTDLLEDINVLNKKDLLKNSVE